MWFGLRLNRRRVQAIEAAMVMRGVRAAFTKAPDPLIVEALADAPEEARAEVARQADAAREDALMASMMDFLGQRGGMG